MQTTRAKRKSGFFLAMAGCVGLSGCDLEPGTGAGASMATLHGQEEEPTCQHEISPPESEEQARVLTAELQRARRVTARNYEALAMLRTDGRWAEPGQHAGLDSAIGDTMGIIDHYEAQADCLEEALEQGDQ